MKEIAIVFLGGGAGSVLRYLMAGAMTRWAISFPALGLPWGTLACNVLASAVLGVLAGFSTRGMPHVLWLLLAVGFCGGWSTFSSFSMECILLFREGKTLAATGYISLSLLLCMLGFMIPFGLLNRI